MSEILQNAMDSLRMGVRHYLDDSLETRDKWAILELFHAIELLLKERLWREHPLLIYRSIDKLISTETQTVGFQEALTRFNNLRVDVPKEHVGILLDLQRRRNAIEHHTFSPSASHREVLGKALKFIAYFLEAHLGEDVQNHLPPKLFSQAKELIFEYEDLVDRAEASLNAARQRLSPKEQGLSDVSVCPECANVTLLIVAGAEPFCHFCQDTVAVWLCQKCGLHLPTEDFATPEICRDCFSDKVRRD